MRPDLTTWRPVGDSVAARLRSAPAELLLEWEAVLVELRRQYWEGKHQDYSCPLCWIAPSFSAGLVCFLCPWMTFEFENCEDAMPPFRDRTPRRRIVEITRWLKRIRAELKARGI